MNRDFNFVIFLCRGAAVAEFVGKEVLVCGGRIKDAQVDEVSSICKVFINKVFKQNPCLSKESFLMMHENF